MGRNVAPDISGFWQVSNRSQTRRGRLGACQSPDLGSPNESFSLIVARRKLRDYSHRFILTAMDPHYLSSVRKKNKVPVYIHEAYSDCSSSSSTSDDSDVEIDDQEPLEAKAIRFSDLVELQENYKLERTLPGHPGGIWLVWLYDHWNKGNHLQSFADLLERVRLNFDDFETICKEESTRRGHASLSSKEYWEAFKKGTKYLDKNSRLKYIVTIGPVIRRYVRKRDNSKLKHQMTTFDSQEMVREHTKKPGMISHAGPINSNQVVLRQGGPIYSDNLHNGTLQNTSPYKGGWCMWVWGANDQFYSHVGKIGRFHHSSLVSGEDIKAAGEWRVINGRLECISGLSGHYKPSSYSLISALVALESRGAVHFDTKVMLYHEKLSEKIFVNVEDFLRRQNVWLDTCNHFAR